MKPEIRKKVIIRDFYTCKRCGKTPGLSGLQIAHRIRNGSTAIKNIKNKYPELTDKYIQDNIIDNIRNLVTTCSSNCNDSFNLFFNEAESDRLLNTIINELGEIDGNNYKK